MNEHKQTMFAHVIFVGPAYLDYTVMRTDRYMTDAERRQWAMLQEWVLELEARFSRPADEPFGVGDEYRKVRRQRDALGLIVPRDHGMDKRPARLLAVALGHYANNVDDIRQANLDIIGMAEDAGEGYDPERLFPEVELTDDEYEYAAAVVEAVSKPVLIHPDEIDEILGYLSELVLNAHGYGVPYETACKARNLVSAIAGETIDNPHCFLTIDGDLVK